MPVFSLGHAFVYVFPCRGEDILKLGFSRDPLDRIRNLHVRYFDFFDFEYAFLIEVDTVREARTIELALGRAIKEHSAPEPLLIQSHAGGRTEWYRGALMLLTQEALAMEERGHIVHRPIREWLRGRLIERGGLLFHWTQQALEAIQLETAHDSHGQIGNHMAMPLTRLEWMLRNAIDAYPAFGLTYSDFVPEAVADWQLANEPRFAAQRISGQPSLFGD